MYRFILIALFAAAMTSVNAVYPYDQPSGDVLVNTDTGFRADNVNAADKKPCSKSKKPSNKRLRRNRLKQI